MRLIILLFSILLLSACGGGGSGSIPTCLDTDLDGICNTLDDDDDGDGVNDGDDAFPLDPTETVDTDGDGTGNNADTDDDGDGVNDGDDPAPLDPDFSAHMDWTITGSNANKWGAKCNGVACNGMSGLLSYNVSTGVANGDSGFTNSATASSERGGMNFQIGAADDSFQLRSSPNGSGLGGSDLTDRRTPVLVNDDNNGNKVITKSMQTKGPQSVSSSVTMGGNSYTYQYTQNGEIITLQIITPTTHNEQLWIKWNNLESTNPTDHYYNFAIVGRDIEYSTLPLTGSATYIGGLDGYFKYDSNSKVGTLSGNSSLTANWASPSISGTFSNIALNTDGTISNFNNISFTNAAISPVGGASPGIAHFITSSVSSGADLDTAGHWLYGSFFDGNHTSGTAPASVGGTFRFEDAANTGYGAFFFAATKQ
ncbi:hypothetical protein OAJ23_02345 [Pelagibacteraceae bacterium]|nr:hypothetical protein [Pelagibacteraceae bacterium]